VGPARSVEIFRVRGSSRERVVDHAVAEEPLEVRLHGRPFATIMRTPGDDRSLAAGFLFAERILRTADDLGTIEHCRDGDAPAQNVLNVTLTEDRREGVDAALADRRHVTSNASGGLCGRLAIETLRAELDPVASQYGLAVALLTSLPIRLRKAQPLFDATGGLHAAGLFDMTGRLLAAAEDIGRHNAVDKVIGRMLIEERLPLSSNVLFVSGRTSFEIVQKAWCAGIPLVASVSAASSLAIEVAEEAGITLVGFVRDEAFNIYAHPGRIL